MRKELEMEESKKTVKKGPLIGAIAGVAVVILAVVVILLLNRKEAVYRIIKVFELDGKSTVTRQDIGDLDAYDNMVLESGDQVYVDTGSLTLKMDEDKYVYAEEKTRFQLEAAGTSENSKTRIRLEEGILTNEIQNKLSDESSYEVNTPNSTMSVRGTIYMVDVYEENGIRYTKVSVFEGAVATKLIYADGSVSDQEKLVEKGKEVLIYDDNSGTDYVGEPSDIDYSALPQGVIAFLLEKANAGYDIGIPAEDLEKYLQGPFTVTFMYQNSVFGTQEVKKGAYAAEPSLMPAQSGAWDFDFSTPINKDTRIEWK
ncbi:MAG: FecR domain-containing protein [Clostridium sp.]|jgi:hypothetical protein|nr:FecR domain-containing protein [Clostridium sp.]